jgi:Flp pilus assembly protein TadG
VSAVRPVRRAIPSGESGASAVEAALIMPLLILLTFGFIEVAMLLRDYAAVTHLARDGSRIASANPRNGTVEGHGGTGGQTSFAFKAADAVGMSGTALPKSSIAELWVYRANAQGFPDGTSSFDSASCRSDNCVRYVWTGGSFQFDGASAWDPADINACPGDPSAMAVGVFIRVHHQSVTNLLPTTMDITDRSVLKFEPLPSGSCKPPSP